MKQKSKMVIRGTSFAERNLIIIFLVLAVFLAFAT
ncbi:MAG TPA: ABC transporter permease, partial [Pseudothermotoga sp.]|nr:ABC transporter permease [Pseudothermotoga sp.]